MNPTPDFYLALPVYDANDALRLLDALNEAVERLWEAYGDEMNDLLVARHAHPSSDGSGQQDLPF